MHDCAIWPGLSEDHLAIECCGDELDQPGSTLGE
jgi:hypothetical protein